MFLPLLVDQQRNRVTQVEARETPLLVIDEGIRPDHNPLGKDEALGQELRFAIGYLLLAGLNGLLDSGASSGRHWPLKGPRAAHAPPSLRSMSRGGVALRD